MNNDRLTLIQNKISPRTALFITKESDIHYFTGFNFLLPEEREAFLVITKSSTYLLYASFNPLKKRSGIIYLPHIYKSKLENHLRKIIKDNSVKEILINKSMTFVSESDIISSLKVKIKEIDPNLIPLQRMVKGKKEIEYIKKSCQISSKSFEILKEKIKVGMTEKEVEKLLRYILEKNGSEQLAFPSIVAFGENTAKPHHQPTDKKLKNNTPILIDFGATFNQYRSDMTRSFWFGDSPSDEYLEVEKIIMEAYKVGLTTTQNNLDKPVSNIDKKTREYISIKGYKAYFIHITGHGVGLDIHEKPSISWREPTLQVNNSIFAIEPGIYLNRKFGIRYENTIHFNKGKAHELTLT